MVVFVSKAEPFRRWIGGRLGVRGLEYPGFPATCEPGIETWEPAISTYLQAGSPQGARPEI